MQPADRDDERAVTSQNPVSNMRTLTGTAAVRKGTCWKMDANANEVWSTGSFVVPCMVRVMSSAVLSGSDRAPEDCTGARGFAATGRVLQQQRKRKRMRMRRMQSSQQTRYSGGERRRTVGSVDSGH